VGKINKKIDFSTAKASNSDWDCGQKFFCRAMTLVKDFTGSEEGRGSKLECLVQNRVNTVKIKKILKAPIGVPQTATMNDDPVNNQGNAYTRIFRICIVKLK